MRKSGPPTAAGSRTLGNGRLRKPTEFALLLADGPSSTRQLEPDLLAVGACNPPMVLMGFGHWLVRLPGRSSPCEASAQGQPGRSA
jgi:hypothetical protein